MAKRLGDILVENGYLTVDQLQSIIEEQNGRPGTPIGQICIDRGLLTQEQLQSILIAYDKRLPLGEMLVHGGVITGQQLEEARSEQMQSGGMLGDVLLRKHHVDENTLTRFLAQQHNYPTVHLDDLPAPIALRSLLSSAYAAQNEIVPFRQEGRDLLVALADPNRARCIYDVSSMTGLNIRAYLASRSSVVRFYERLYGKSSGKNAHDASNDAARIDADSSDLSFGIDLDPGKTLSPVTRKGEPHPSPKNDFRMNAKAGARTPDIRPKPKSS